MTQAVKILCIATAPNHIRDNEEQMFEGVKVEKAPVDLLRLAGEE
jgi:hypothetical protein